MKPILFNTEMVRAILDGRKTVTRRLIKPQPLYKTHRYYVFADETCPKKWEECDDFVGKCAPYKMGDVLYVRETWFYEHHMEDKTAGNPDLPSGRYSHRYIYKADNPDYPVDVGVGAHGWKPSIHMPKEAARIFLRVTDVRIEKLGDMSVADIDREGLVQNKKEFETTPEYFKRWISLWNSTIKNHQDLDKYGWNADPWVWVISFKRCEAPK